jgi:hypothetical protein
MEFKLFGPGGYPSSRFKAGLSGLFALDDAAWDTLANWFLTAETLDVNKGLSSPTIVAGSIRPEEFEEAAEVVLYMLQAWHAQGLQINELQRDLMLLGYHREQIERLTALLNRVSKIKVDAHQHLMREYHETATVPMLQDIDLICDIRPIFEHYNYPPEESGKLSHTKLLGFSCVVLAELEAVDRNGKAHTFSFQMTEERLIQLQNALKSVAEQMDILKTKTNAMDTEQPSAKRRLVEF